jgi:hypothetical protein
VQVANAIIAGVGPLAPATAPTIASFTPTNGPAGTVVTITGTNLSNTSSALYNGAVAAFTRISATQVTFTVPIGATNGVVALATPSGSVVSADSFSVSV